MAPRLVPVDHDPFAEAPKQPRLTPVDNDPFAAAPQSGPIEATADIGRLMLRGAAMGKEATPEDAADRANALRQSMGRKVGRGRMPEQPAATPEQYRPFFQEQQQEMAAASKRAGLAGDVAEFGGLVLSGGKVGGAIEALGKASSAAPVVGKLLASPWTAAGATGAVLGASQAQGTDQNKLVAALLGSGAGIAGQAAGNAISGGVAKAAGIVNAKPQIPTREAIEAAKKAAYQEAENAGVVFTPQFAQRLRAEIEPKLANLAYDPAMQPKIAPVLARLEKAGQENNTMAGIEVLRKMAGNAYDPMNKSSNQMMGIIKREIDDAFANPAPGTVLMGDTARGAKAIETGRKNAQIGFKLDDISKAQEVAKLQTATSGSGGNIDNNTRRKIAQALLMPGKGGGLTVDERAAAERLVFGSTGQNIARLAGKLSPSGNGLMAAVHAVGAGATGGATLPLMALGMGAKGAADRMTQRNLNALEKVILAGGSRAATLPKENAIQRLARSERERLARLLMMGGITAGAPLAQ